MSTTSTLLGKRARSVILRGINKVYEPVRTSFGPEGKNALLFRSWNRGVRVTNDGFTISECQIPKNPYERISALHFKEACKRTNEIVGDGTTCTTIVAGRLANDVFSKLDENESEIVTKHSSSEGVMSLKKKLNNTAERVKDEIQAKAQKIESLEDLEKIATVSVQDEKMGKIIAGMAYDVGVDGFIDTVQGFKNKIETEVIHGMRFPAKLPHEGFINRKERYEMVAVDCPVLVTNYAMDNVPEVVGTLNEVGKNIAKIIVIAPSFSEEVQKSIALASKKGYEVYPVAVPSLRTDQFVDLSVYCGATFINKQEGKKLKNVRNNDLGFLEKLIVKGTEVREDAVATGGKGSISAPVANTEGEEVTVEQPATEVEKHIEVLKGQLEETKEHRFKQLLERRIASMASSIGVIKVGGSTDAEALYMKLKIEDAVYACRSALRSGYVRGGGICLKEIAEGLPDGDILREALFAPHEQIQSTMGGDYEIPDDVIDPMEAIYYAVEHAVGVVSNLATVDSVTVESEDRPVMDGMDGLSDAIRAVARAYRKHHGLLVEYDEEMEKELMNGLSSVSDMEFLDQG